MSSAGNFGLWVGLEFDGIGVSENPVLRDFDDSLVQTSFLGTVSLSGVMPVHENQRPISRCNDDADGASIACASGIFVLVG